MLIGVPKEIKVHEYRVGLTPASVREAVHHGHRVLVETGAGLGIGADDAVYRDAGADIASDADQIFAQADLIVKVKEPQPVECRRLRPGQMLFTYLHLAPDPEQAKLLRQSGAFAIAYETVTDAQGGLPLLAPMSEVAGRMAVQAGAHCLEKERGGSGILLAGAPGVPPAKVCILGGGTVGANAARIAIGMGAEVVVLDKSLPRLRHIDELYHAGLATVVATQDTVERHVARADLVIGAVLTPGASAPKLVSRALLARMRPGSAAVDVSIDQGGCFETSRPTTHANPTYVEEGIVHYCVTNMPGAVPRTSAYALNSATLPFVLDLADRRLEALRQNMHLRAGLNVAKGQITCKPVADALGLAYVAPEQALAG